MLESNYQEDAATLPFVAEQPLEARKTFIERTYTFLAIEILLFILIEAIFLRSPTIINFTLSFLGGWSWLLLLGGYFAITSLSENWAMSTSSKTYQYIAMLLYVVAEALLFTPLIYLAIKMTGDTAIINQAATITITLFLGITSVAFITKKDFSMLRIYLSVGTLVAIGLIAAGLIFGFSLGLWFSFAMVALAAGAILYQTSAILHKYHAEQYVAASLGLFGSVMLLFWYVINILSSLSGD
ncbi:Bax inhibitor-1/YccA family protein [Microscilla marina]|uniref:Bax inhibitor-1/YccA family protein n=1 Tax=Microscilla marina TaxID=1027 RepID=UPI0005D479EC|nr:Bax inhibitor-1 family protein [Microscilla marina]